MCWGQYVLHERVHESQKKRGHWARFSTFQRC
jgi:hypothetical protein